MAESGWPSARHVRGGVAFGLATIALLAALTGCTTPHARPSSSPSHAESTSTALVPDVVPTPNPKGTAQQNQAYFDYVNNRTIAKAKNPTAEQFVAGLAAGGFDKTDMQMTADRTTVDLTPGSVQFSVLVDHGCLIGQFGQDIGGYHSVVAPVLHTGKCLIGDTVPVH